MNDAIAMIPVYHRTVSFREFVQLSDNERAQLKDVRIVLPQLGRRGFGKVVLEYRAPRYVRSN